MDPTPFNGYNLIKKKQKHVAISALCTKAVSYMNQCLKNFFKVANNCLVYKNITYSLKYFELDFI